MNLQAQLEGSLADLQNYFTRSLFNPDLWLRTLLNTVVVSVFFILVMKGVGKVGGKPGKAIAGALGV